MKPVGPSAEERERLEREERERKERVKREEEEKRKRDEQQNTADPQVCFPLFFPLDA